MDGGVCSRGEGRLATEGGGCDNMTGQGHE